MNPVRASEQRATAEALSQKYAGFERRLPAFLIDTLISFAAVCLAAMIMRTLRVAGLFVPVESVPAAWATFGASKKLASWIAFLVSTGAIYVPLCHSSPGRATVGKWVAKIHVATPTGARLSFSRALWRWFVQTLLGVFSIGLVSIITILADSHRRALHDFAAATVVEVTPVSSERPSLEWRRVAFGIAAQTIWLVVTFWFVLNVAGA